MSSFKDLLLLLKNNYILLFLLLLIVLLIILISTKSSFGIIDVSFPATVRSYTVPSRTTICNRGYVNTMYSGVNGPYFLCEQAQCSTGTGNQKKLVTNAANEVITAIQDRYNTGEYICECPYGQQIKIDDTTKKPTGNCYIPGNAR